MTRLSGAAAVHIGAQSCYLEQSSGHFLRWFTWKDAALRELPENWSAVATTAFDILEENDRFRIQLNLRGRNLRVSVERFSADAADGANDMRTDQAVETGSACVLSRGRHGEIFYRPIGHEGELSCYDIRQLADCRRYWKNALRVDAFAMLGRQYFAVVLPIGESLCLWLLPIEPKHASVRLSPREAEAVSLAAQGYTYRVIAAIMHITEGTVKKTLFNAGRKR